MANPDITLPEALAQQLLAETVSKDVFAREFGDLQKRLEKQETQSFQVIIGVLIASVLILVTVAVTIILFVASFNQNILDSKQEFSEGIDVIQKETIDFKTSVTSDFNDLKEKQNYVERLLIEKSVSKN